LAVSRSASACTPPSKMQRPATSRARNHSNAGAIVQLRSADTVIEGKRTTRGVKVGAAIASWTRPREGPDHAYTHQTWLIRLRVRGLRPRPVYVSGYAHR